MNSFLVLFIIPQIIGYVFNSRYMILCYIYGIWGRVTIAYSQTDPAYTEDISIKIDGQINNLYLGTRGFTGQIYCTAVGLDGEYFNILFDDTNKSYLSILQRSGKAVNYGEIFADKKIREAAEKTANKYFAGELF